MNILTEFNQRQIMQPMTNVAKENGADNYSKLPPKTDSAEFSAKKSEYTYKPDFLDKLSENVVNKRDLNDMVTVPRSVFKGYLCFVLGTTVNSLANIIFKSPKTLKAAKAFNVLGSLISFYGTFNFVKPFLIKDKK